LYFLFLFFKLSSKSRFW